MDKLFSAGKEFLESQSQNQGQGQGQSRPTGGKEAHGSDFQHDGDDGLGSASQKASQLAGSSGSSELFSQIMGAIGQRKGQIANEDVDEEGAAAAMQALKMFGSQGQTGDKQSQGAFLALAMSEASKLFDDKAAKGKLPSGASKESTIQKAGEMAMKMYFKSQAQQQGGLLGMASKFMK